MKVRLTGNIVPDDSAGVYRYFGMDVCCPNDIRSALDALEEGEGLELEINSMGGSVSAGMEMYSMIRGSGKNVTAKVYGWAASAMSLVMCACTTVAMSPSSLVMIHRSSTQVSGNSGDLKEAKQMLDSIDEAILNAYETKCAGKTSREQLKSWMKSETFFTAQQAVSAGLADSLLFEDELDAVASIGVLPPADELRAKMDALQALNEVHSPEIIPAGNIDAEEREQMEITNTTELREAYSELVAQIEASAASAERARISEIHALSMSGCEDIIEAAVNDPAQNAGTVAVAIIARQKEQGKNYLAHVQEDAQAVNAVPAAPAPETKPDPQAEAKVDAADVAKLWKENREALMGGAR